MEDHYSFDNIDDGNNALAFISMGIMMDVLNYLSTRFHGLQNIDDYKALVRFLAPKVLDCIGMIGEERKELEKHFPMPSNSSVIPFTYFLFNLLTKVKLGVIDGQHRFCALLSCITGFKAQIPSIGSGRTQYVRVLWSRQDDFLQSYKPFQNDCATLNLVLNNMPAQNVVLYTPLPSIYKNNFESFRFDCWNSSFQRDVVQAMVHLPNLCVFFLSLLKSVEGRQDGFVELCLAHYVDVGFVFNCQGIIMPSTCCTHRNDSFYVSSDWVTSISSLHKVFLKLSVCELVSIVHDVQCLASGETSGLLSQWEVKPDHEDFDECLASYETQKDDDGNIEREFYPNFNDSDEEEEEEGVDRSVYAQLPLYAVHAGEVWVEKATWRLQSSLGRDERRSTISTPALLAVHDTWKFLDAVTKDQRYQSILCKWATELFCSNTRKDPEDMSGFLQRSRKVSFH